MRPPVLSASAAGLLVSLTLTLATASAADGGPRYAVASNRVEASFRNFDSAELGFTFDLDPLATARSMGEFGYSLDEVKAIQAACAAEQCGQEEFDRRVLRYYQDRGFRAEIARNGNVHLTVDIAAVLRRNAARVVPLAREVERVAATQGYGSEQTFGSVVAFVQSAVTYREPPLREGGREIAGFYPPPRALQQGFGDCDTKSALLGAVMKNFSGARMIGVHVPGHYLVAIHRVPRPGEAFVEYRGDPYVLVEAAGPGVFAPGRIAEATRMALETTRDVRLDPLL